MRKATKFISLFLSFVAIGVAAVVLAAKYDAASNRNNQWKMQEGVGVILNPSPKIRIVGFTRPDRAKISHVTGHAHSPFGTRGDDIYHYDGLIKFDGRELAFQTDTYRPYALLQIDGRYFMILLHYFNGVDFMVRASDGISPFQPIAATSMPTPLCDIQFTDLPMTFRFRVWLMHALADAKDWDGLEQALNSYLDQNPRSMSISSVDNGWQEMRFNELIEKIEASPPPNASMSNALIRILGVSLPTDSFNSMAHLMWAILDLDPTDGRIWLCKYKRKVTAEGKADDSRLAPFVGFGDRLKNLPCSDVGD